MGKLYDFTRLIRKYSNVFEVISSENGEYVDGKYQAGLSTVIEMTGAIIPMTERKIYQSGGTLKSTDRQLYTLTLLPKNCKVRYKNNVYSVEEETNYEDYADVYVYVLKWVSNFDRSKEN